MDEIPKIRKIKENHYIIDSKVLVSEVNDLLGVEINDEDMDTIGGWILTENYEAKEGDILLHDTYSFKILDMEEHHIKYIEVMKNANNGEATSQQVSIPNSEVLS